MQKYVNSELAPSTTTGHPWLYSIKEPKDMEELVDNHVYVGKWKLFCNNLDEVWAKAKTAYDNAELTGVTQMKCPTGSASGNILFFCSNSDVKDKILESGKRILNVMNYATTPDIRYSVASKDMYVLTNHLFQRPNFLVIDCETTGLPKGGNPRNTEDYENSRLLELGYVLYNPNTFEQLATYSKLVRPDDFVVRCTDIHGITQDMAYEEGVSIADVLDHLDRIMPTFGVVISHNIAFDIKILLSEMFRYGRFEMYNRFLSNRFMCTMAIGTQMMGQKRRVSLSRLMEHLNVTALQKHRALPDAQMCLDCLIEMKKRKESGNTSVRMTFSDLGIPML